MEPTNAAVARYLTPYPGKTKCPLCNTGISVGQADVISALGEEAKGIEDLKFYCMKHLKILPNIGLATLDIRNLRNIYFKRPPTIFEVFHFAYTMNQLSSSEDNEITDQITTLASLFGITLSTKKCVMWLKSIKTQPEYTEDLHYFNPIIPFYKTNNQLIFLQ